MFRNQTQLSIFFFSIYTESLICFLSYYISNGFGCTLITTQIQIVDDQILRCMLIFLTPLFWHIPKKIRYNSYILIVIEFEVYIFNKMQYHNYSIFQNIYNCALIFTKASIHYALKVRRIQIFFVRFFFSSREKPSSRAQWYQPLKIVPKQYVGNYLIIMIFKDHNNHSFSN